MSLTLTFETVNATNNYNIRTFSLSQNDVTVSADGVTNLLTAKSKEYYKCSSMLTLYNNKTIATGIQTINLYSLQFEAFRTSNSSDFSENGTRCSEDNVSQLVPIIVGAVLAGLIVVVLIAYLNGRRQSQRGYESV
jgi:lysosomal-associated membrane protein 1/2